VTTTKDHLEKSMLDGQFRQDLFYRVNVATLTVPPLRDRKEQVVPIIEYYLTFYQQKYGKDVSPLSAKTLKVLEDYPWPGNVRELENVIKRFVLFRNDEGVIQDLIQNHKENGLGPRESGSGSADLEGLRRST